MTNKFQRALLKNSLILKVRHFYQSTHSLSEEEVIIRGASHMVKMGKILAFKNIFGNKIFVETGTYLGEMVSSLKDHFEELYSIEIEETLAEEARIFFQKSPNIYILTGDSSRVLTTVTSKISRPAIFWLDAHYSAGITGKSVEWGNTPIIQELKIIFSNWHSGSNILIDDARLFNGRDGYPTIEDVKNFVKLNNSNLRIEVRDDIISIF